MADETKWTPADVRALVGDIGKWALIVLGLVFGYLADQKATKAREENAVLKSDLKDTRVKMGLARPGE
jgi:hypothetical protein